MTNVSKVYKEMNKDQDLYLYCFLSRPVKVGSVFKFGVPKSSEYKNALFSFKNSQVLECKKIVMLFVKFMGQEKELLTPDSQILRVVKKSGCADSC